jgi:hypothetical protein
MQDLDKKQNKQLKGNGLRKYFKLWQEPQIGS